jgi:hypothetical protein
MSSLEEKRKKLLALRAKTRNQQSEKLARLHQRRNKRLGIPESTLGSTMDESVVQSEKVEEEPENALTL